MIPTLETNRLILRPLSLKDAPTTQALFPHWEIVRFLSAKVPWPYPENGAYQYIKTVAIPSMERGEQWMWAIRAKDGPDHQIGAINLNVARDDNRGFWMGLPWHGRGYMSEAAEVVTDFWFFTLKRETLRVAKAMDNIASRRISEKQGAKLVGIEERDFVCGHTLVELWQLTRDGWTERRRVKALAAASLAG